MNELNDLLLGLVNQMQSSNKVKQKLDYYDRRIADVVAPLVIEMEENGIPMEEIVSAVAKNAAIIIGRSAIAAGSKPDEDGHICPSTYALIALMEFHKVLEGALQFFHRHGVTAEETPHPSVAISLVVPRALDKPEYRQFMSLDATARSIFPSDHLLMVPAGANKLGIECCAACASLGTEFKATSGATGRFFTMKDRLSCDEYIISGLCQSCQDETFKPDPEDIWDAERPQT